MSNSKLTKSQKAQLKEFKRNNPRVIFACNGRVTICIRKTGSNTAMFATAICSPDEQKVRRKVGEYYAMLRFINGPMPMNIPANLLGVNMDLVASDLAGLFIELT